jgi:LysM repeat protein
MAVVVKGDTLHGLSLKHRVSVKAIMSANNLTNTTIFLGQKLVIPDAPR